MKFLKYKLILFLSLFPLLVSADEWYGLDDAANIAGITTRKPADITTTVINMVLGFLGTLFIVLILLGGFKWMTSQGNRDQVQEAKDLIRNATIGLAIVLVSFTISRYVLTQLREQSGLAPATST